ncbi:hypothetical protein CesoFtcFv8_009568 [Champsocephalus esox]|nr:hypothetical protein CesoFtcFv8_009568 [Champsocephalus esox]
MKNAEVEEEDRLTAEKGEKAERMKVENEERKEKVITKNTVKERKGESERMEDLKTGEKPPPSATATAAATAVSGKAGEGKEKTAEKREKAERMEVENEERKEKVINKIIVKERKGESERLEDLKTGEEPPAPAAAATAGSVKAGEAEKEGIKVFSLKKRLAEREQKRKEEDKQNPEEGPSGRKQKSDGANPEMGSGGEKADGGKSR